MAAETIIPPVHPGEILLEEFLGPLSLSQCQLAKDLAVPARRSTKSFTASGASAPIPHSDSPATSAPRSASG